jgi:hypothetical protein
MTNDAVFLAAIFGLAALPSEHFPYVANLRNEINNLTTSDIGGGC